MFGDSDTDWLVYADYLEDQGIDATHIREGLIEEIRCFHEWVCEYRRHDVGCGMYDPVGSVGYCRVGSASIMSQNVGCSDPITTGYYDGYVGG